MKKPRGKGRRHRLTDDGIPSLTTQGKAQADYYDDRAGGLHLRVGAGGRRTWCLIYGFRDERRKLVLGHWPTMTVDDALAKAAEVKAKASAGEDPEAAPAEAETGPPTFKRLAEDFLTAREAHLAPKTFREWDRLIRSELLPTFGSRLASEIKRRDVRLLLAEKSKAAPVVANRIRSVGLQVYRFGIAEDDEGELANPFAGIEDNPENPLPRPLLAPEVFCLWHAMPAAGAFEDPLRLLLLSGVRLRTALGAKVEEVSLDRRLWTVPRGASGRAKMRRTHHVPLAGEAYEIMERRLKTARDGFVFPSDHTKLRTRPLDNPYKSLARLNARASVLMAALLGEKVPVALPRWTPHDFRDTLMSHAKDDLGTLGPVADRLLSHPPPDRAEASRAYDAATSLGPRREALEAWAGWVRAVAAGDFSVCRRECGCWHSEDPTLSAWADRLGRIDADGIERAQAVLANTAPPPVAVLPFRRAR